MPIPPSVCSVRFDLFDYFPKPNPLFQLDVRIRVRLGSGDETLSLLSIPLHRSAPELLLFSYYLSVLRASTTCAIRCFVSIFGPLMPDLHARTLRLCAHLYLSSEVPSPGKALGLLINPPTRSVPCATRSLSSVCPLALAVFICSPTPDACRFCCSRGVRRPPLICGDRDALPRLWRTSY